MDGLMEKFLIGGITGGIWGAIYWLYEKKSNQQRQKVLDDLEAKAILEDDPSNPPKSPQESWDRLNNKAGYYYKTRDYTKGIEVTKQALDFSEQNFGSTHENTATTLNNLALLCKAQGNFTDAETHLKKALEVYEASVGRKHEKTLTALKNLYELAAAQAKAKR